MCDELDLQNINKKIRVSIFILATRTPTRSYIQLDWTKKAKLINLVKIITPK